MDFLKETDSVHFSCIVCHGVCKFKLVNERERSARRPLETNLFLRGGLKWVPGVCFASGWDVQFVVTFDEPEEISFKG